VEPNAEVTFATVIGACAMTCSKLDLAKGDVKDISKSMLKKDTTVPSPNIQVCNAAIRKRAPKHWMTGVRFCC